jgi:predicted phosphohydrolase
MLLRKVHPDTHEPTSLQLSKCLKRNRTSRILYGQVHVYGQLKKGYQNVKNMSKFSKF